MRASIVEAPGTAGRFRLAPRCGTAGCDSVG
jgi:hypothetical protein